MEMIDLIMITIPLRGRGDKRLRKEVTDTCMDLSRSLTHSRGQICDYPITILERRAPTISNNCNSR